MPDEKTAETSSRKPLLMEIFSARHLILWLSFTLQIKTPRRPSRYLNQPLQQVSRT